MPPALLTIDVEPLESGKLVHLPMAPLTSKENGRGRMFLQLKIRNDEPAPVTVESVTLSFPGSNVPSATRAIAQTLAPGEELLWWPPEPKDHVLFALPGPTQASVSLKVTGHDPNVLTFGLAPHKSPGAGGAFLFPARASELRLGEFWAVNGMTHGVGWKGSQLFGYDMDVVGVDHDTGAYSGLRPLKDAKANENFRVWGKTVVAMADGVVLQAVNDCPNNPAPLEWTSEADLEEKLAEQKEKYWGGFPSEGAGNHVFLQHGDEITLYAHMQKGSLNPKALTVGALIKAGEPLGRAGNSGNSTAPHLHIHSVQGPEMDFGPFRPLVFKDAYAIDNDLIYANPPQAFWSRIHLQGLPGGTAANWQSKDVFVHPGASPPEWPEIVRLEVPEADYQAVFTEMDARGFRPVWIDGHTLRTTTSKKTFFNVVFRPRGAVFCSARHGMSGDEYQTEIVAQAKAGFRLVHVESYFSHYQGRVAYAAIFEKTPGPATLAHHGKTEAEHAKLHSDNLAKGFQLGRLSVVSVNGTRFLTALYEAKPTGDVDAAYAMTADEYQARYTTNAQKGMELVHVKAYDHSGATQFVGVWHQNGKAGAAQHHLDAKEFEASLLAQRKSGRLVRAVAGYQRGGVANWAALWTR